VRDERGRRKEKAQGVGRGGGGASNGAPRAGVYYYDYT